MDSAFGITSCRASIIWYYEEKWYTLEKISGMRCHEVVIIPNGFLVELNYKDQKISSEKRNERINERINALTKNARSILESIEKKPRITQVQLAEHLNLTEQYIRKLIKKLKNAALIQRIGSNKTGFWKITS